MISDADHEPLAVDHDADHEPLDECRRMVGVGVGVGEVGGDEPGDFVRFELPDADADEWFTDADEWSASASVSVKLAATSPVTSSASSFQSS